MFVLLRGAGNFVENIRVGKERPQTGLGTKQDRPSTIFGTREVSGIRVTEDSSAEGDELSGAGSLFLEHKFYAKGATHS